MGNCPHGKNFSQRHCEASQQEGVFLWHNDVYLGAGGLNYHRKGKAKKQ